MKKVLLKNLPEFLLIIAVLFYWVSAAVILNPFAIGLIVFLGLQIIFQNKTIGILIPSLLTLTSLYMIAALLSEFSEFPTFSREAQIFLSVGLTYFISTMFVAGLMINKYVKLADSSGDMSVSV